MRTRDQVKKEFAQKGITISAWAKSRGYKPTTVFAVLDGRIEGRYGISHRIAVDLGIKPTADGPGPL